MVRYAGLGSSFGLAGVFSLLVGSAALAQTAQVTAVDVVSSAEGVTLQLTIDGEMQPQVFTSRYGTTTVADLTNTQLTAGRFQQDNPAAGIRSVVVEALDVNSVRVTVIGDRPLPPLTVTAEAGQLMLSTTATTEAQTQEPEPTSVPPAVIAEPEVDPNGILRIVVTAERTPEDVQDVPLSITPLTEQTILDADITSLEDVAANTPNFAIYRFGSRAFTNYSIRGLGNSNFLSRDAVGFYVDGVPYDWAAFIDFDLPDLERVEVLRGPQSILYGRNASAGVVNLITRRPSEVPELIGSVGYGSFRDRTVRVSTSGPLVEDRLFLRLAGSYAGRDGYTFNTALNDSVDSQSGVTGRAQLLWTPDENWDITLNTYLDSANDGGYGLALLGQPNPFEVAQTINGNFDRSTNTQSLQVAYSGNDLRVTSITSRRGSQTNSLIDADVRVDDIFQVRNDFNSTLWTQELRLQSAEETDRLRWLVGGYFESRAFANDEAQILGADAGAIGAAPGAVLTQGDVSETTLAAFGQASYTLTNALTLTGGLRYESVNSTLNRYSRTFALPDGTPVATLVAASDIQQTSEALLPRLALEYRPAPNVMLYGSITRGYRPGGVNFRAANTQSFTFEAERSWNYELGAKSSWLGDRLTVNAALFHNSLDNYQVIIADLFNIDRIENAGVSIWGGELEIRAIPVDGLEIVGGIGLANARFTDYVNPATGVSFTGNRLTFSPDFTYNLAAQYRSPIGLLGRLELVGVGATFFDDANTLTQAPYTLVNARLGYEFNNYGIYLFANNLFGNEYITRAFAFPPFGDVATFGSPRTFGAQVRAEF